MDNYRKLVLEKFSDGRFWLQPEDFFPNDSEAEALMKFQRIASVIEEMYENGLVRNYSPTYEFATGNIALVVAGGLKAKGYRVIDELTNS